jgi:dTMP kinase
VLAIPAFRKLWQAMAFSSFGDWLGLLASTALAQQLAGGDYAKANFAIAMESCCAFQCKHYMVQKN